MNGLAARGKYDLSFTECVVLVIFWPSARKREKEEKALRFGTVTN